MTESIRARRDRYHRVNSSLLGVCDVCGARLWITRNGEKMCPVLIACMCVDLLAKVNAK